MKNKLLILSGPTHEYLDPVRFIGNASSGLMGRAIARAAVERGLQVDFISGPVPTAHLPDLGPDGRLYRITGAAEMLKTAEALFPAVDAAVFAAAVADYAPASMQPEKMARQKTEMILKLKPTTDIAQTLGQTKRAGQITFGFALQTRDGEANAYRKLQEKRLDGIVLNTPASLGAERGTFSYLAADAADFERWGSISKADCAGRIVERLIRFIREK